MHATASTITEEELDAIHEAGHAVARATLMRQFYRVTLADDHGPARIEHEPLGDLTADERDRELICAAAGILSESLLGDGRESATIVHGGRDDAAAMRELLGPRSKDHALVDGLLDRARQLVEANLGEIRRVADALLERGELSKDDVFAAGAPFWLPAAVVGQDHS